MKKSFIVPDYKKSVLNVTSTIAEFLGCPNDKSTLPLLRSELEQMPKDIVYLCFDGLGVNVLNENQQESRFLRSNIREVVTSTFPSTTACAVTSIMLNSYPLEHGWFGQTLFFKELNKEINVFKYSDALDPTSTRILDKVPLPEDEYFFYKTNSDYKVLTLLPDYFNDVRSEQNLNCSNLQELFDNLGKVLFDRSENEPRFVFGYCNQPDYSMHREGISGENVKKYIKYINDRLAELYSKTDDVLFIIIADHGQIEVKGYVDIYKDSELLSMLQNYPYIEPRAMGFSLKDGCEGKFVKYFTAKYNKDFELHSVSELIDKGLFGSNGKMGYLLGDYMAIGTYTYKQAIINPCKKRFLGHHTSLTEEMLVPLIMLRN